MTINERLEFFKEMLRCNYDVYLWTYTPRPFQVLCKRLKLI